MVIFSQTALLCLVASGLATLAWYLASRAAFWGWVCMWIFGFVLLLVLTTRPLIKIG